MKHTVGNITRFRENTSAVPHSFRTQTMRPASFWRYIKANNHFPNNHVPRRKSRNVGSGTGIECQGWQSSLWTAMVGLLFSKAWRHVWGGRIPARKGQHECVM